MPPDPSISAPSPSSSSSDDEDFEDVLPTSTSNATSNTGVDISIASPPLPTTSNPPTTTFSNISITLPPPSVQPVSASVLPTPRSRPLPAGGQKETSLLLYLDAALEEVGKRVSNRHVRGEKGGFKSFGEVAGEVGGLVGVVWVSGTPTLQTPYLLSLLTLSLDALPAFKPSPSPTLTLLTKFDTAFAALLCGKDPETQAPLPGFNVANYRGLNTTDKVRIKGLVERARIIVTRHLFGDEGGDDHVEKRERDREQELENGGPATKRSRGEARSDQVRDDDESAGDAAFVRFDGFEDSGSSDGEDGGVDSNGNGELGHREDGEQPWEVGVGRLFERTLAQLGDVLGGPPIGIVTDEEADVRRQMREDVAALEEQEQQREQDADDEGQEAV